MSGGIKNAHKLLRREKSKSETDLTRGIFNINVTPKADFEEDKERVHEAPLSQRSIIYRNH